MILDGSLIPVMNMGIMEHGRLVPLMMADYFPAMADYFPKHGRLVPPKKVI